MPSWSAISLAAAAYVPFAHPVRLRRIERDVEDVNAVELRHALGGGRQGHVAGRGIESDVTGRQVEVQHLDEQRTNLASPLSGRRGKDMPDAVLDFNRVITVHNRHLIDL